VSQ
jgi:hypothetical protein